MKQILFLLLISVSVNAQRATIENDTLKYKGVNYYKDKVIDVSYGSGQDKKFAYIYTGSGLAGLTPMLPTWSKYQMKIDKVMNQSGKPFVRGILLNDKGGNAIPMNKIFIDIMGAVDFKEID
jgi:hypothetical protein